MRWRVSTGESKLFKSRWQPLDKVLPASLADSCSVDADTLWAERSFPLAFDTNPNVLFYASNVGRSTYGVFGINLSTGEPTALAAIDREVDLADPAATLISPALGNRERRFRRFNVAMHYTDFRADQALSPIILDRRPGQLVGIRPPLKSARTR